MVVESDVMDVRLRRPDSQPDPELNAPANSNAPSHSDRSETHAEPEAEVSTSAGTDRVRFREERDSPRHHLDVSSDRELMEEPRGKMQRRADTSESVVPFHSSEASSSKLQQVSTAAASDSPTGERLYLSMTEEGPSGDCKQSPVEKKKMEEEEEMSKRAEEEELRVPSSLPLSSLTPLLRKKVEEASLKRKREKRKKRKLPRGGARLGYERPYDPAAVPAVPVLGRGASDSVHQQSVAFPVALQRQSYVDGLWVRIVLLVTLSHFFAWIF